MKNYNDMTIEEREEAKEKGLSWCSLLNTWIINKIVQENQTKVKIY